MKVSIKTAVGIVCLGLSTRILAQQANVPPCAMNNTCVRSQPLTAKFFPEYKSQRVLSKYGPFLVPAMGSDHSMGSFTFRITPPCTECLITEGVPDLQYPDGKYANANTGMWLHHAVVFNNGTTSPTCPQYVPAPVLATGNERTIKSISINGTVKAGYPIDKDNNHFFMVAEFMNEAATAREVVFTIEWEYVPSMPADFKHAALVWLDVDGPCLQRGGEVPVPDNGATKVFTLEMNPPWTAQISGDVLQMVSHMHDGGDELEVIRNGEVVCRGKARYGEKPGFVSPGDHSDHTGGGGHHDGHGGGDDKSALARRDEDIPHISSISSCFRQGRVEIGDKWHIRANYNLTRYKPMSMGDHLEPIMGITAMYIALDPAQS